MAKFSTYKGQILNFFLQKYKGIDMPEEKNAIVVKNVYYPDPDGLRELTIKEHYQKYKEQILKEVGNHPVVFAIATDVNQFVIRRLYKNREVILNYTNYDFFMHGRVISIFVELGYISNLWLVDIDPGKLVSEEETKDALEKIIEVFRTLWQKGYSKDKEPRVISTSRGYHVLANMKKRGSSENNIHELLPFLKSLEDKYIVNKMRNSERDIVIDLSVMKKRGSHVVPFALNRNGLMAMDITTKWKNFKREDAIVNVK